MKTIILYATKYGASREIARRIAEKLPDTSLCDLKRDTVPPLSQYGCVIIGGSLYAGMLRKEAKNFAAQHASELSGKKLGLFLSGMDGREESLAAYFGNNFPQEVLQNAKTKAFLGGIYDPSKVGFLSRIIFKAAAKQSEYKSNLFEDKIVEFAEALKA